jgi:hypothetical protein
VETARGVTDSQAVDRRRFLKRAGTVAWMAPAILTLSTQAAYASHCLGKNAECGAVSGANCVTSGFLPCCTQCSCTQSGPPNNRRCRCSGNCPSTPS